MDSQEEIQPEQLQSGDPAAFRILFEKYYPSLTLFARRFVTDLDMAKEIVQDLFVHIYENRTKIMIGTSVKSYLFQAVRNSCLNAIRTHKVHQEHHEEIKKKHSGDADWTDWLVQAELEEKIAGIISSLPAKCKQIYLMSRQQDLSNREIAGELNLSVRTVETQISKALGLLRNQLSG